jgi:hypothetical protein
MCIKASDTELGSIKALMAMSLNAVVADVFALELDQIRPELRLYDDLRMTQQQAAEFAELVAEYFDGVQLRFTPQSTLGEIFDGVIEQEFAGLAA